MQITRRIFSTLILLYLSLCNTYSQTPEKDFARADSLIDARQYEWGTVILDQLMVSDGPKEKYLTTRAFAWLNLNQKTKAKQDYEQALQLNPSCTKCYVNLGIMAADDGDYPIALAHYQKAIELDPDKAMAYIKRGELYYQTGFPEKAILDFDKALTIDRDAPYIYLWRSMTKLSSGDATGALDDINQSIKFKPEVEYAYYIRGKCYVMLGQYENAWNDLSACLQKNASFNEYHTYAGIALYYLREYTKSMQALNESIRLDSTSYLPYQYRSYLHFFNGKFSAACLDKDKAVQLLQGNTSQAEALKKLLAETDEYCNTNAPSFYKHTGDILFQLGYYDRAAFSFDQGLKKFSRDPVLSEGKGNTAIALGNFEEALRYYYQTISNTNKIDSHLLVNNVNRDRKTATAFFMAQVYNSISFAQLNLLRFDSAILSLGKAISLLQLNPDIYQQASYSAVYLSKRGLLYALREKYTEANADFTASIQLDPKLPDPYLERATMLIQKNTLAKGDINKSTAQFQPTEKKALSYITTPAANASKDELQKALQDCDKAISLNPTLARAFLLRAQVLLLLKKENYCADIKKAELLGITGAAAMLGVECK